MFWSKTKKTKKRCVEPGGVCSWEAPAAGRSKRSDVPRLERPSKASPINRVIFYFLELVFVCVAVYVLFFSGFLQIRETEISGNNIIKNAEINKLIQERLSRSFFNVISLNNYILISSPALEAELADEFKRIKSIEITKFFPDRLKVKITERQALLVFCSNECYVIDEDGKAYQRADFESPDLKENNIVVLKEKPEQSVSIGEEVLDKNYLDFVLRVPKYLADELRIETNKTLETPSRASEEIRVITASGWNLLLSTRISLDRAMRALRVFLSKEMTDEKLRDLEYVDLRSDGKVYYKLRSQEAPAEEQATGEASSSSQSKESSTDSEESTEKSKKKD